MSWTRTHRHLLPFPTRRSSDLAEDQGRTLRLAQTPGDGVDRLRPGRPGPLDPVLGRLADLRLEPLADEQLGTDRQVQDRKSTRLNSSHLGISYAVFCLKKKKKN